ncbi:MAG TPA: winged helix DNA-binding protein, partial [Candidatus Pygmaiobacter gallistercoris]|nr:winged helix DNA-binding protein [Candidatus Pygmaiobacter gallistercoris]
MDATERAVRRLMLATEKIDGAYYLFARRRGAKENEMTLLWALDDGAPHTQRQICRDWLIPKTTVNTNVKALAAAGYLELLPARDGREKQIALTPAGRAYARGILRPVHEAEEAAMRRTLEEYSPDF